MSGVSFADNINIALSSDYLALSTHFLYRSFNLHKKWYCSPVLFFCLERFETSPSSPQLSLTQGFKSARIKEDISSWGVIPFHFIWGGQYDASRGRAPAHSGRARAHPAPRTRERSNHPPEEEWLQTEWSATSPSCTGTFRSPARAGQEGHHAPHRDQSSLPRRGRGRRASARRLSRSNKGAPHHRGAPLHFYNLFVILALPP